MSQDSLYESTFGASLLEHEDAAPQNPTDNATMGELICERAGVLNLGIEGIMTVGAFAGWFTVYSGGDLWAGVVVADAWMWSPFVMLLVLAGLVSVPKYLYEAAEVDRASWWRRFSTITFPYIRSLLLLAILFRTIETFKLFDIVYIITQGGPGAATETIGVYVYRVAFQNFRTSQSTALAYIVLFVVIELLTLEFTFLMIAAGTLIGGLGANLIGWPWWVQIGLAAILSALLIFAQVTCHLGSRQG